GAGAGKGPHARDRTRLQPAPFRAPARRRAQEHRDELAAPRHDPRSQADQFAADLDRLSCPRGTWPPARIAPGGGDRGVGPSLLPPAAAPHRGRSTAPRRSPVSLPWLSVSTPLTSTCIMPLAGTEGSKRVARSVKASGSKMAISAKLPAASLPRPERPSTSAGWPVILRIASSA